MINAYCGVFFKQIIFFNVLQSQDKLSFVENVGLLYS